ncbi:MAG: Xylose isomerase-like TIM barrel [candidate division BRC1 bacterium ADurb.BinA292]|nr:MAG: Xylose isomerase-like TIM barrel [candidate division BRC1 bacterium ADurb.BinA292]
MKNRVGVITPLPPEGPILRYVADFGLDTCQLCCWDSARYTPDRAATLVRELRATGVQVTSLWAGWPGPAVWNFTQGPATLGIVPRKYRAPRVAALKKAADFAARTGLPAIVTHLGFIPENPGDPLFGEVVETVRDIARYCRRRRLEFWFETGQETPITLLRLIESVDTGNLGINLDPANLILYGKGNPIDALEVFGNHVKGVHAKDGVYPTEGMNLGHEVKVGQGRVRFPAFVRALTALHYRGAYIIEREISGDQQRRDIRATLRDLKQWIGR